jgi:hypothetical protein
MRPSGLMVNQTNAGITVIAMSGSDAAIQPGQKRNHKELNNSCRKTL